MESTDKSKTQFEICPKSADECAETEIGKEVEATRERSEAQRLLKMKADLLPKGERRWSRVVYRLALTAATLSFLTLVSVHSVADEGIRVHARDTVPETVPYRAAAERGGDLYGNLGCAICHGNEGRGGDGGPSLMNSQSLLRDEKGETIGEVLLKGVPNTRMAAYDLTTQEVSDIAYFLHWLKAALQDTSHKKPPREGGGVIAGKKYFDGKCHGCHSASGDLKGIGAKYPKVEELQQQWLMPRDAPPTRASVSRADGSVIDGQILNVDEFQVTLRLENGSLRTETLARNGSSIEIRDSLAAHRALLSSYTDLDAQNVTAYLATLRATDHSPLSATTGTNNKGFDATVRTRPAFSVVGSGPDSLASPLTESWPTYAGDYSGRRFSSLSQINQSNITQLTLSWTTRLLAGSKQGSYAIRVGGEGSSDRFAMESAMVRGSVLAVDGVLYVSTPENAWALDARNGNVRWRFIWKSLGGNHWNGSRGPAIRDNFLYFETSDAFLVSLDARTGEERWHVQIANVEEGYYASTAPVIVGNHVLVGTGSNFNLAGFLASFDAETGHLQWKQYSVPMKKGDPGLSTWKNIDTARHGGGQVWIPGVYDPKSHLYIYGTGNPTPAYVASIRGDRDALFTCTMIAIDVNTGKIAWYYQTSPNDTHDWDSAQTPILADILIKGQKREVVMTAARNGYFFVLDRNTGTSLLTRKFAEGANWAKPQLNAKGQPVRLPEKDPTPGGTLLSPNIEGAAGWFPASYSTESGLFYVPAAESWILLYKADSGDSAVGGALSMAGQEEFRIHRDSYLKAIDPRTGNVVWSIRFPSGGDMVSGVLTTAGRLLFSGDPAGNLVARDTATGAPLWHARIGPISNAPETYLLDNHQFVLVAGGETLYAFSLQP